MNKEFQTLRKKQRFGLRKLNIGVASVLLGFTIFGYNLASQAPVAHADTSTVPTASAGSGASGPVESGSSASGVASGSQDSNSQATSATSSAATDSQEAPEIQGTAPAASQSSAPANSGNETSSPASQAGTVSANQTSNTSAAGAPASSDQTVTVDETTLPATQAAIPSTNLARLTNFKVGTRQRHSAMLLTNLAMLTNSETDTPLPTTTQTYDKVEQPLLYDYGLHTNVAGTRDRETWVDKTVARGVWDYPSYTLDTIFGKTGIITSNPDKYFFAAYVDFSEQYHRVILLAWGQDPSDKNLYSYTIHTYSQNNSTTTTKPGESIKEQYTGPGGSTHDLFFQNYGDSFSVKLIGRLKDGYGLLPVFDEGLLDPTYGSNTLDQNDKAAQTESISFWASAIPKKTSTKVRYVDQATGKDIVQPMEISGFGYQGFKVKGDTPTVKGYHLVSKPEFLPSTNKASAYEDGTISPYKVGQTYDLALSDSVVIKQTVIDTNGTVRATAYYNGSRLPSTDASKVLGRESNNDHMSFGAPDGKFYTYTNRIGQVDGSYIYYYAKDSDPNGSEMRLHFIDVTGVNNSNYAPSDGPELDVDKVQTIHGNIGKNYNFTYTVPKGYDQVATSGVTGTYSKTHHDAYVYVKANTPNPVTTPVKTNENTTLTDDQAKAAISNNADLPADTTYKWSKQPDTKTYGDTTGEVTVTYPGGTSASVTVPVHVNSEAETNQPEVSTPTVDQNATVDPNSVVTNQDTLPKGTTYSWTTEPKTDKAGQPATGSLHVTYPDGSSEDVPVTVNVKSNADQYTPEVPDKTKVDDPTKLTNDEKKEVEDNIRANNPGLPEGTKIEVGDNGDTTITYPDKSVDTIPGNQLVEEKNSEEKTSAEKLDPTVKDKTKVDNPTKLTNDEKKEVEDNIRANNPGLPEGTKIAVGDNGDTTITYPDKSVDTIPGNQLVEEKNSEEKTSAEKLDPTVKDKTKVDNPTKLTNDEKKEVEDNIRANNPGLPEGTKIAVGDNGDTTITYPDKSVDTITGDKLVEEKTSAEKLDPTVKDKTKVDDKTKLTADEKKEVEDNIRANNPGLPEGTKIAVGDNGDTTITYPDKSVDTIPGNQLVEEKNSEEKTSAEKLDPTVKDKTKVDDKTKLTNDEKKEVEDNIRANNPGLPEGTKIAVGDNGDTTITYPDKSVDTIPGNKLVEEKTDTPTPTEKTVNVVFKGVDKKYDGKPAEVTVTITDQDGKDVDVTLEAGKDYTITKQSAAKARMLLATAKPLTDAPTEVGTYHVALTEAGKQKLKDAGYTTVNETPADFTISPADTPTPTPDTKTDDEKYDPIIPGDKVKVDDPTKLTNDEKEDVVKAVEDANKDDNGNSTLPDGTKITVGDNGDVTVTYPDGSEDTIPGDKVVEGKTDADKNEPNVPSEDDKVKVDDPTKLTDGEKEDVVKTVEDANKDDNGNSTLPDGTKITVGDNGDVTVTYPDGTKDTIDGDQLVEKKNDADKNEPNVPGDKVKVDDPTKLTDDEKGEVVKAVEDANKDDNGNSTLPDGTKITVDDNGDVTVTYPDGSKDTIPGDKVVEGKTDAGKTDVTVPGTKVEVSDPTKLTDGEKGQVEEAIKDANPNLPDGTKITVADDGTATILYPDGSYKVIDGQDLVTKPGQTTADQVTPVVPGDKVTVVDPNHLTDAEKDQVKTNVEKANQNNFPAGTVVTVADDGTATITYPDGSVDQISAADLITKPTAAGQAGKGTGTTTTNGQGAPAGQGKADQAKTLPQTGNEQGSLLAASGLGMLLLGMLGLGGKRKKED